MKQFKHEHSCLITVSSILDEAFSPEGPVLCKNRACRPHPGISGPIRNDRWTLTGSGWASQNSVAYRPLCSTEKFFRLKTLPLLADDRVRVDCSANLKAWLRSNMAGSLVPGPLNKKLIAVFNNCILGNQICRSRSGHCFVGFYWKNPQVNSLFVSRRSIISQNLLCEKNDWIWKLPNQKLNAVSILFYFSEYTLVTLQAVQ